METSSSVEQHLRQAFYHLTSAVNESVDQALKAEEAKRRLASMWEAFLVQFFEYVKDKGKEKNVNMIGWISLSRLSKMFWFK